MGGSTYTAYEFHGFIAEWDGRKGQILTDGGERVFVSRYTLEELGVFHVPQIGDRIHFWAKKENERSYRLTEVRMIATPNTGERGLTRLKNYHQLIGTDRVREDGDSVGIETLTGTVSWFDGKKGYGFIGLEDGNEVLLHITCLRASGYQTAPAGSVVRFEALRRPNGRQAFRVLSMTSP